MFNWTDQQIDQHSNQACTEWVWVLFPGQLSATNRAFVIRSILVDYFYIEGAHITIYIIVRTWIQAKHRPKAGTGQRSQNEFVRFSWNCNRASPQIIVSSQWQFLKDPHLALILESTFQRLIARASTQDRGHNFSQYGPAWASELNFYYYFFLKLNGILSKRSQMV